MSEQPPPKILRGENILSPSLTRILTGIKSLAQMRELKRMINVTVMKKRKKSKEKG
jgi:hypothetical protein